MLILFLKKSGFGLRRPITANASWLCAPCLVLTAQISLPSKMKALLGSEAVVKNVMTAPLKQSG